MFLMLRTYTKQFLGFATFIGKLLHHPQYWHGALFWTLFYRCMRSLTLIGTVQKNDKIWSRWIDAWGSTSADVPLTWSQWCALICFYPCAFMPLHTLKGFVVCTILWFPLPQSPFILPLRRNVTPVPTLLFPSPLPLPPYVSFYFYITAHLCRQLSFLILCGSSNFEMFPHFQSLWQLSKWTFPSLWRDFLTLPIAFPVRVKRKNHSKIDGK